MKRSFHCLFGTAVLLAFVTACAPTPPSPSGETSPPPTLSVVEPTTTPAVVATPTPSPAEPTPTPAPTSPPLDFNAEPPLDEFSATIAVPDFLTEEQQDLYRRAHCLYQNMFGGFTAAIDFNFPAVETVEWKEPAEDFFVLDDWLYQPARGRYQRWADFDATVHGVFTDRFWESKNIFSDGLPIYRDFDGRLGILELERGSGYYYNDNFPDEFRLDKQTEEEISFTLIGHYSPVWPKEGETYEERDARLEREYEYTLKFPIKMVLTEDGWRFDEFHSALADEEESPKGRIIEDDKVSYVDERLGFSMEFPESWRGKLEVEQDYDKINWDGGHCITFYHKPTRESWPGGVLFHIDCYPGIWTEDDPPVVAGSSIIVLQTDRYTFFFRTPSDVQWHEWDEALELAYKAFMADFDYIQSHITPIN